MFSKNVMIIGWKVNEINKMHMIKYDEQKCNKENVLLMSCHWLKYTSHQASGSACNLLSIKVKLTV